MAGVRQYDLIVMVDGVEVHTMVQVVNALQKASFVNVTLRRAAPKVAVSAWN
jgi:hypothetical protein